MASSKAVCVARLTDSLSFSVRNFLRYNEKGICSIVQESGKVQRSKEEKKLLKKERKLLEKEKTMKVQSDYRQRVRNLVDRFRNEHLESRLRQEAAEGEKQQLQKMEREEEKRIIEGVNLENEKLQELRKERLEIEEWTRRFRQLRQEAKSFEHQKKLREMRVEMVKKAIEESKHFITADNLEEKIAYALDNETYYNFALKPDGEKVYSTSPPGNTDMDQPGPAAFILSSSGIKQRYN